MSHYYDILIVGGGISGSSIAKKISENNDGLRIGLIEKEMCLAYHQSSNNSGVLHAGLHYPENSRKMEFCVGGNRFLKQYCKENKLPINEYGKVIVAKNKKEAKRLEEIEKRATANGVEVYLINEEELYNKEPYAITHEVALSSPTTAVINPVLITESFAKDAMRNGADFSYNTELSDVDADESVAYTNKGKIKFKCLVNVAGLHADEIAHGFGLGKEYTIIPFRGNYYMLKEDRSHLVKSNIYPVPDPRNPFLGVHYTRTINGDVIVGPTATPIIGRENYKGFQGANLKDTIAILSNEVELFLNNRSFRELVREELCNMNKKVYAGKASEIVRSIIPADLITKDVVQRYIDETGTERIIKRPRAGIRAQAYNTRKKELVPDFVVETGENSINWVNVVSPGITGSIMLAELTDEIVQDLI